MSNFKCKIRIKRTGEIKDAYAQDDFFGKHKYGYADGDKVYREDEVKVLKDGFLKNMTIKQILNRYRPRSRIIAG